MFFEIGVLKNFATFTGKHALESLLNKVASLKPCNFIKKRLQHRCFPVNIAKFLRTTFFTEHLRRLLLIVTAILSLYALIINNMRKLEPYSFFRTKFQTHCQGYQSFPYENHYDYYKKLASRTWTVLFTLTYFSIFFLIHAVCWKIKIVVIVVFLSKLDHRPLFNDIYYNTILL